MELLINQGERSKQKSDLAYILKSHPIKVSDFKVIEEVQKSEQKLEQKTELKLEQKTELKQEQKSEQKLEQKPEIKETELEYTIRYLQPSEVFELFVASPKSFNEAVITSLSDDQVEYLSEKERLKEISEKNKELMYWVKRTLPLKSTTNVKNALLALKLPNIKKLIAAELEKPKNQRIVLAMVCENNMDWGKDAPKWSDGLKIFFNESEGLRNRVINIFRINKMKKHILEDGVITDPDEFIRKMIFLPTDLHKQEELNSVTNEIISVINTAIRTPIGLFEVLK